MQRITVFLGPSLDRVTAEGIIPAVYLPPAKRGDFLSAVDDGSDLICLIDGVFHQDSAVAHREILYALKKGIRVIGASSMGALRAAELDTLGMEGVGEIYRMYKDGRLVSDDEVALIFDPVTFAALSEPLINIRCTLEKAESLGIISARVHRILLNTARSVFYPQRLYSRIVSASGEEIDPETKERFLSWVENAACDKKREDAITALHYIHASMKRTG
jgi:TfuA protein